MPRLMMSTSSSCRLHPSGGSVAMGRWWMSNTDMINGCEVSVPHKPIVRHDNKRGLSYVKRKSGFFFIVLSVEYNGFSTGVVTIPITVQKGYFVRNRNIFPQREFYLNHIINTACDKVFTCSGAVYLLASNSSSFSCVCVARLLIKRKVTG